MVNIDFSEIQTLQAQISELRRRFSNYTRYFNDFAAPLIAGEIAEAFETEGRGEWPELDEDYAAWKSINYPGKSILRREDNYIQAATSAAHPGNVFKVSPFEMTWGVDGGYFESAFGYDYPSGHELGEGRLKKRPVFELLTATGRLDEELGRLFDKWATEEIAEVERLFT